MNTTSEGAVPVDSSAETPDEKASDVPDTSDASGEGALDRYGPIALVVAVATIFFTLLPPLSRVGLWDPYELNIADLARRVAIHLHNAPHLALEGTDNSLPHLNDLGRPQLPFTSIALGFKTFGLREWAGRLPLALWGLLGVVATYGWVSRLSDRRAGVYSALALTAMPLYFVQARTMIGDVTTMASLSFAVGGFAVVLLDDRATIAARATWFTIGVIGLAGGWLSRGGMLGLGVPLLAVGLAAVTVWGFASRVPAYWASAMVGACLVLGGLAVYRGVLGTFAEPPANANLNLWVGAMVKHPGKYPTFDFTIAQLGHSLAPWSAFLPFAFGRLFAIRREARFTTLATVLVVGAGVSFAAHGFLAARTDIISYAGTPLLAGVVGLAIRDFEREGASSVPPVAVGVGTAVFLGVFHHDFHTLPEKAYQAFGILTAQFPESFKERSIAIWTIVLVGLAVVALVTWLEEQTDREPFDPKSYVSVARVLGDAYDGMLALAYFAIVAGASLAALGVWAGTRYKMSWLPHMGGPLREGLLNAWWVLAFVPLGGLFAIVFLADLWLWAFAGGTRRFSKASFSRGFEPFEAVLARLRGPESESLIDAASGLARSLGRSAKEGDREPIVTGPRVAWFVLVPLAFAAVPIGVAYGAHRAGLRWPVAVALGLPSGLLAFTMFGILADVVKRRAGFFLLTGVLGGALLCGGYFPEFANQLSPKEVFGTFLRVKKDGEPLGLFGVGGRTSAYYAGGETPTFHDSDSAYKWLSAAPEGRRRYVAINANELARLNFLHRARTQANLPVLDARSSQIMLVASSLRPNETNENPIDKVVLQPPVKPQRTIDVNFEDKLQMFGLDVTDAAGRLVEVVSTGKKFHIRTYYRVTAPMAGREWKMFIHIDGYKRRHNGDHAAMGGKYPFAYWAVGDIVVDDYEFTLEPNFAAGTYTMFMGFFDGETRLKVTSGPNDGDNRVNAGALVVR